MKAKIFTLSLAITALSSGANAFEAYVTGAVNMRAGPSVEYPVVATLTDDQLLYVNGCLTDYNWCDVQTGRLRGWVSGNYLEGFYNDRQEYISQVGPVVGVPIVSFEINNYWDRYYKNRSFYGQRDYYRNQRFSDRRDWNDDHHDRGRDRDRNWGGRDRDNRDNNPNYGGVGGHDRDNNDRNNHDHDNDGDRGRGNNNQGGGGRGNH